MSVLIIDYGTSNIDSVKRAVEECGHKAEISADPKAAATVSKLILPGVGNFSDAAPKLKESGWDEVIRKEVLENKIPLLGICLGMQLLGSFGEEGTGTPGLGLIPGKIERLQPTAQDFRIPHMGWNQVHPQKKGSSLFHNIQDGKDFYFVHSYHFKPTNPAAIAATTPYCGGFVSAVEQNNIYGVQFHPEKSQKAGFRLLKNFLEL